MLVDGPLDVLRSTEVRLNVQQETGELARETFAQRRVRLFDLLLTNRSRAQLDRESRGRDLSRHEPLSHALARLDEPVLFAAGQRMNAERDARHARLDHALHEHREPRCVGIEPVLVQVREHARSVRRISALLDARDEVVDRRDVQIRLVLPSERRSCEVFENSARPHRDRKPSDPIDRLRQRFTVRLVSWKQHEPPGNAEARARESMKVSRFLSRSLCSEPHVSQKLHR